MTQATQPKTTYWETHKREVQLSEDTQEQPAYINKMCPNGLALDHPAAATHKEYATYGCPEKNGRTMDEGRDMGSSGTRTTHVRTIG